MMADLTRLPELDPQLARALENLTREFTGIYARETITACLHDSLRQLSEAATVSTYLPLLAHRFTHQRLRDAAGGGRVIASARPAVLFVCAHDAGRSQMATALLDHRAGGRVGASSATSRPVDRLNPVVGPALAEIGLNVRHALPKPLTTEAVLACDVIITMGCGDACPILLGKRYLDWALEDPADKGIEAVRRIRDDIDARVRALLADLRLAPNDLARSGG
jgi:arsenate reductase